MGRRSRNQQETAPPAWPSDATAVEPAGLEDELVEDERFAEELVGDSIGPEEYDAREGLPAGEALDDDEDDEDDEDMDDEDVDDEDEERDGEEAEGEEAEGEEGDDDRESGQPARLRR